MTARGTPTTRLPGLTAVLFPTDRDTSLASTTTGSDGTYTFVNVPVGRYRVAVQPGAGQVPTSGPRGSVDPDTWLTPPIEIRVSGDDITQAKVPMTGVAPAVVPAPGRPAPGQPTTGPARGRPSPTPEPGRPSPRPVPGQPSPTPGPARPAPAPNKPAPGSPSTRTPGPGQPADAVPATPRGDQPTASPTATPKRPETGHPAAPADQGNPGKGGSLAFTGSPVDQLLWWAAGLLGLGTALLLAGRRRGRRLDER